MLTNAASGCGGAAAILLQLVEDVASGASNSSTVTDFLLPRALPGLLFLKNS
jgi:hypothetical protein